MMELTTVQWNIGGAKTLKPGSDASLLASYSIDGLQQIITRLKKLSPDIITLQETHANHTTDQVQLIANALGLRYYRTDSYADSHIEAGQKLSQGIISRFPITDYSFEFFTNPYYEVVWQDGSKAISHDKGVTTCVLDVNSKMITVETLHALPFGRFNVDPLSHKAKPVLMDMQEKLRVNADAFIIQGDFNLDYESLAPVLPGLLTKDVSEVILKDPTTPKGKRLDHVVFKGLDLISTKVFDDVLTDHYPVVAKFRF